MSALLEVRGVTKRFGGLTAVHALDMSVPERSICSVIGPNGAGKTTLFNCVTGFYHADDGELLLDGEPITELRPDEIAKRGISRTYQNIRLFANLTAIENVMTGLHMRLKASIPGVLAHSPSTRREEEWVVEESSRLLDVVGLAGHGDMVAGSLPYGDQRRLEIGRALATEPRLLLLDEPTAGMNPRETHEMIDFIRGLRDTLGITILLIEHDMRVVMAISEGIVVMDFGEKIAEGAPAEIQANPRVIEAYLGRGAAEIVPARIVDALLECRDVHTYYGQIQALKGISLEVGAGEIVTLIGGNGAGKSTTLKTISGLLTPRSGDVLFEDHPVTGRRAHQLVRLGIVHVPEGRGIFGRLTVEENLRVGAYARNDRDSIRRDLERAYDHFPRLRERRGQRGGTLSGGEQQMLAIGRGLMARPRILLLDEPSMGLAPILVEEIFAIVRQLNAEEGVTLLLVEQNALAALDVADRGYVIETGAIRLSGPAQELKANPQVIEAYLGGG